MYSVPQDPNYRRKLDTFLKAAEQDDVDGITALLQDGFPVNATSFMDGALHMAAKNNSLMVARVLLQQPDVNVNIPFNQYYLTPLDFAVKAGYTEMVELLKQHGGRSWTEDPDGLMGPPKVYYDGRTIRNVDGTPAQLPEGMKVNPR